MHYTVTNASPKRCPSVHPRKRHNYHGNCNGASGANGRRRSPAAGAKRSADPYIHENKNDTTNSIDCHVERKSAGTVMARAAQAARDTVRLTLLAQKMQTQTIMQTTFASFPQRQNAVYQPRRNQLYQMETRSLEVLSTSSRPMAEESCRRSSLRFDAPLLRLLSR